MPIVTMILEEYRYIDYCRSMNHERCPTCKSVLPPAKTCANRACGKTFYRSENGSLGTAYCSKKCADATRVRRWRAKRAEESSPET